MACYRNGGCGPYEMYSCNECPASKSDYLQHNITNADRIRAMTDEELAEFISGKARTFGEEYEGYMSALEWLKKEVEE